MNCQECQNVLDNLLVTEPTAAAQAALDEHLKLCSDCAGQYAQARRALAAVTIMDRFPVSPNLKARILDAISGAELSQSAPTVNRVRRIRRWQIVVALAAAAALWIVFTPLLHPGRSQSGPSALGLLAEAYAAEENQFKGNQIVHLLNEIIVEPVADAALAHARWLPLMALEANGKPAFNQLNLPAEVDKGYTVEDESWYDPATGRFARVLTSNGKPIFANSFDGTNVYIEETPAEGPPRIVSHAITKDFEAPKSPAEFLGIAAGLRSGLDVKDESLVSDVRKVTLADGAEARMVKLAFPKTDPKEAMDSYWLMTIRTGDNTLEQEQWFVKGKSLLVIRRGKAKPDQGPSMGWDLAGIAKLFKGAAVAAGPTMLAGMLILDVTVEHMVKKADFATYIFSKAPSWAADRQITDCLDVASPPHRMFITCYRAKDHRHVVLVQAFTYNSGFSKLTKAAKVIYTSPSGIKVWSGPRDEDLAKILLMSAIYVIKDRAGKEITGYFLETPAGTFPALAINGKLSEEELHELIDSLVPAE